MRAVDFLLETVTYYARGLEGPPPVVPFHADAEFETDLVSLCHHHHLSPLVSDSFDELALPPTISRITIARIKHDAASIEQQRRRRRKTALRILNALDRNGIRAALMGDVPMSCTGDRAGGLRPVGVVKVMIDENQWMEAVGVLREEGFVRSRIQPRLVGQGGVRDRTADGGKGGAGRAATTEAAAADALRYHQYFAPLVLHDHAGDVVQLRFRVIDFTHPGRSNAAWDRVRFVDIDGESLPAVGPEDELIHTVLSLGVEGFVDLLLVLDAGRMASCAPGTYDLQYLERRLRDKKMYPAFYFTLEHVCAMLHMPGNIEGLQPPPEWRRWLFHRWWKPEEADFRGETEPGAGRFSYGLIESGGLWSKLLWLRRGVFPRSSWVRSVYGRPANMWLRLKFLHDVRAGRRRRPAEPAAPAEVSDLKPIHE
jgi:hypothetical protein